MNLSCLVTATTAAATTTAPHRRCYIFIASLFTILAQRSEDRKETLHLFTMAFHAYNIVSMLMAHKQFKFCPAVRAVVLVQRHRNLPPVHGKAIISISIVLSSPPDVKRAFKAKACY